MMEFFHVAFLMDFTPRIVFVTAPSIVAARALAKLILEQRLAACVNLFPEVESHYWWKDKLESAAEVLLLIKTSAEHFDVLRQLIALHHTYECPEVVALDPREVAPAYRRWWEEAVTAPPTPESTTE